MRVATTFCLAAALAGCAAHTFQAPPAIPLPEYRAEDHAAYFGTGNAAIRGQAFMRQQGGAVVTCAGEQVFVMPATSYFRELVLAANRGRGSMDSASMPQGARLLGHVATCDAQGNFVVADLPPARWLVLSSVKWSAGRYSPQGGALLTEVSAPEGGTATVLLSDKDYIGR